jgi:hypothetical protein
MISLLIFIAMPYAAVRFGEIAGLPVFAVRTQPDPAFLISLLANQAGPCRETSLAGISLQTGFETNKFFTLPYGPPGFSGKSAPGGIHAAQAKAGKPLAP